MGLPDVHGRGVAAVRLEDGGEAAVDLLEGLVPGGLAQLAVAPDQRGGQPVGVLVELLQPVRLGADEAAAEHVLAVAAHGGHPIAVERDLEPAGGFAERAGAVVDALAHVDRASYIQAVCQAQGLMPGSSRSSIQSAREAQSSRPPSSNSAHAAWRLRPSTSSGHDTSAWRSPTRTPQPIRAVSRASTIGGPSPKFATGALVGQSSAPHRHSGRTCPSSSASDSSGVQSAAKSAVRSRQRSREDAVAVARLAVGPADHAGGKGVLGRPLPAPGLRRRLGVVGVHGLGHVEQQLGALALGHQRGAVVELHPAAS